MSHNSSNFWLSLPTPEISQRFAISFTGSRTQRSVQSEAHFNSPKNYRLVPCNSSTHPGSKAVPKAGWDPAWGQRTMPHDRLLALCPGVQHHLIQPPLMGSPRELTEPWAEATKFLQSPACEDTIFGTSVANPQMHKYANQSKALQTSNGKKTQIHHFFLICFPFPCMFLLLPTSPKSVSPLRVCGNLCSPQQQPDWQSVRKVGLSKLSKKHI